MQVVGSIDMRSGEFAEKKKIGRRRRIGREEKQGRRANSSQKMPVILIDDSNIANQKHIITIVTERPLWHSNKHGLCQNHIG